MSQYVTKHQDVSSVPTKVWKLLRGSLTALPSVTAQPICSGNCTKISAAFTMFIKTQLGGGVLIRLTWFFHAVVHGTNIVFTIVTIAFVSAILWPYALPASRCRTCTTGGATRTPAGPRDPVAVYRTFLGVTLLLTNWIIWKQRPVSLFVHSPVYTRDLLRQMTDETAFTCVRYKTPSSIVLH